MESVTISMTKVNIQVEKYRRVMTCNPKMNTSLNLAMYREMRWCVLVVLSYLLWKWKSYWTKQQSDICAFNNAAKMMPFTKEKHLNGKLKYIMTWYNKCTRSLQMKFVNEQTNICNNRTANIELGMASSISTYFFSWVNKTELCISLPTAMGEIAGQPGPHNES